MPNMNRRSFVAIVGAAATGTALAPLGQLNSRVAAAAGLRVRGGGTTFWMNKAVVRRGDDVRAWRNLCPHQWLPLTYRSPNILSADGLRLRCSNHGAEFSSEDGRPLVRGESFVPLRIDEHHGAEQTDRAGDRPDRGERDAGRGRR